MGHVVRLVRRNIASCGVSFGIWDTALFVISNIGIVIDPSGHVVGNLVRELESSSLEDCETYCGGEQDYYW